MKLAYARVFVVDFASAMDFYANTLQLKPLWRNDDAGHGGFDGEGCTFSLSTLAFPGIHFKVEDILGPAV